MCVCVCVAFVFIHRRSRVRTVKASIVGIPSTASCERILHTQSGLGYTTPTARSREFMNATHTHTHRRVREWNQRTQECRSVCRSARVYIEQSAVLSLKWVLAWARGHEGGTKFRRSGRRKRARKAVSLLVYIIAINWDLIVKS